MAKVTSKLQVTIPKLIADRYRIRPGAEIEFLPDGDTLRVATPQPQRSRLDAAARLHLFDQATERQQQRESGEPPRPAPVPGEGRGWAREDLYDPPRGWRP